ncbi:MAG TPA: hypothetical protein VHA10_11945 [Hypericibacter adhaerens]|jgi:hypothetical protein|uniref:Uncharacterized protein n=1 Tax=Hypericibacter adhaerens TaxID=2602016 RepID=A0A5J6MZV8_9PROT|nr:hypothetical protein [Hypericibacter adhaerens]QEX21850.1 hypothetical protein FRZ61_17790 [Hypericibacter adhaerens]HWA43916.1 hypothetical protein [Hypericibacter adhaerens]
MSDTSKPTAESLFLPNDPPTIVIMEARRRADALRRSVYIYGGRSNWMMTTDLHEPPSDAAVWLVAANDNDPKGKNSGRH